MSDEVKKVEALNKGDFDEAEGMFADILNQSQVGSTSGGEFSFKKAAAQALTKEQKLFFNENGYLIIKGLLSQQKIDKYTNRLVAICNEDIKPSENMLVMKDVMVAKGKVKTDKAIEQIQKLQDIQDDEIFWELLTEPEILDIAENFCGPNMKTVHNMVINKPPRIEGRHPFHQDQFYFPFGPDEDIVGCWISFQATTIENGTLAVIPGSHKFPVLEHGEIKNIDNINLAYFGALGDNIGIEKRVHIIAEPGDAVFFHTHLLHGAGRNRSDGFRRVYITHYANSDCHFRQNGKAMATMRHYTQVRGVENSDPETI